MKTYESTNQAGKEAKDAAAKLDQLTDELLSKCREALMLGGGQARRRIVLTTIKLEGLLREVQS